MTATSSAPTRELVALNADVVGYSKLLADDLETTTAMMEQYHELVQRVVANHAGTLVNFVGDNFMAVFDSATDAMGASIAMTAEIEDRNADLPEYRRIRFRMGLDQGDIAIADDQYFGDALNIAARIQSIAPPGGVSVSSKVYKALDEPQLRFHPMGKQNLKNIPEEIGVYRFADLPTNDGPHHERSVSLETPTISIMPTHTENADDSLLPACEVIRSDLIHRLARIPNLNVINATSSKPADTAARYFLESGIMNVGNQVRVYCSVVDGGTWNVTTSHRWTTTTEELLGLSDEITEEIARALEVELVIGEPARIYAELKDPIAQQTIYDGWFHLTSGTKEGWDKALHAFESVAQSHPEQPVGHILAGFTMWVGVGGGLGYATDREQALRRAWELAQKGIDLGDPTGLGTTIHAAILMSRGLGDQALETIDGLEITRPTCDVTYAVQGSVQRYLGEWEKAIDLTDTAMRLSATAKPWYPTIQACSLYMGGRLEEAASTAEAVVEHQPHNLEALLVLAAAQQEMGLERRAKATAQTIRERYPAVDVDAWLKRNPYEVPEMVDRWRENLVAAGVIDPPAG